MISMQQIKDLRQDPVVTRKATLNVKIASRLLDGKDIRDQITIPDIGTYLEATTTIPFRFIQKVRGSSEPLDLSKRLQYPDPKDFYFGYLQHAKQTHDGLEVKPLWLDLRGKDRSISRGVHRQEK